MNTSCFIAKKVENGYKAIYCRHCDGYLEDVGETLENHYKTDAKVEVLLNQGDISILGTDPIDRNGEKYWFRERNGGKRYSPTEEDTISYKSRGEDAPAVFYPELKDMKMCGIKYIYVWQDYIWNYYELRQICNKKGK